MKLSKRDIQFRLINGFRDYSQFEFNKICSKRNISDYKKYKLKENLKWCDISSMFRKIIKKNKFKIKLIFFF